MIGEQIVEDGSLAIWLLVLVEIGLHLVYFFADHLDNSQFAVLPFKDEKKKTYIGEEEQRR